MSEFMYNAPYPRGSVEKIGTGGTCIYCGLSPPEVRLTDEHIIADGLGGDLVYPNASCVECARKTGATEQHVITGPYQWARGIAGVRSRKRKRIPLTAKVRLTERGEEVALPLENAAPFIMPFPISDRLPGILTGSSPEDAQKDFRIGLFGQRDWFEASKRWAGGPAKFRSGFRAHLGIIGQVIAKTAHSYACARLGLGTFTPYLQEYILADEPPFDAHRLGIYSSHNQGEYLHSMTLNLAIARKRTHIGWVDERMYLVAVRFFANRPTPTLVAVVGRPISPPPPSMPVFDARTPI